MTAKKVKAHGTSFRLVDEYVSVVFENGLNRLESTTNVEKHAPEVEGLAYLVLDRCTNETILPVDTRRCSGWE